MAIAGDGTGAQFGLWEAGTHPGSQVAGQSGSLTWAELRTRSRAPASGFYEAMFGWEVQSVRAGAETYITCLLDEEPAAGMVELGAADGKSPSTGCRISESTTAIGRRREPGVSAARSGKHPTTPAATASPFSGTRSAPCLYVAASRKAGG